MSSDFAIRRLDSTDAGALFALRRRALLEAPLAFAAGPEDDLYSSVEAVAARLAESSTAAVFGAFDGELVGMLGLYRPGHAKLAHKVHLWGLYVRPERRRQGLGRALLEAAIDFARSTDGVEAIGLTVSTAAEEARQLYEAAGFRHWGTEPDALRHEDQGADEHHMVLMLE